MSKYTLDFNSFMNEGTKPKSGVGRILEDADKKLLDALAEIEKLELEAETEPKEVDSIEPLKEKSKGKSFMVEAFTFTPPFAHRFHQPEIIYE